MLNAFFGDQFPRELFFGLNLTAATALIPLDYKFTNYFLTSRLNLATGHLQTLQFGCEG